MKRSKESSERYAEVEKSKGGSMSQHSVTRQALDITTKHIKETYERRGKEVTESQARREAVAIAERRDKLFNK